jgi:hypothetical protein
LVRWDLHPLGNFSEFLRLSSSPFTLDFAWRDNRWLACSAGNEAINFASLFSQPGSTKTSPGKNDEGGQARGRGRGQADFHFTRLDQPKQPE